MEITGSPIPVTAEPRIVVCRTLVGTNLKIAFGRLFGWRFTLPLSANVWYLERGVGAACYYSYNYDHEPQNLTDESYSWADCKYRAEET